MKKMRVVFKNYYKKIIHLNNNNNNTQFNNCFFFIYPFLTLPTLSPHSNQQSTPLLSLLLLPVNGCSIPIDVFSHRRKGETFVRIAEISYFYYRDLQHRGLYTPHNRDSLGNFEMNGIPFLGVHNDEE